MAPLPELWAAPLRVLHIGTLELSGPASGIPGVTAIVGLWLSTGPRVTVVFLTFSVLAQGGGGHRVHHHTCLRYH